MYQRHRFSLNFHLDKIQPFMTIKSSHSLVLVYVCFILILISCSHSLQDIIEDTKDATVTIYTFDEYGSPSGEGSGFFIDDNGTCLTNYHVLDGATKAILKTSEDLEFEIDSVLLSNKKKDIITFNVKNPENKKFAYLTSVS